MLAGAFGHPHEKSNIKKFWPISSTLSKTYSKWSVLNAKPLPDNVGENFYCNGLRAGFLDITPKHKDICRPHTWQRSCIHDTEISKLNHKGANI